MLYGTQFVKEQRLDLKQKALSSSALRLLENMTDRRSLNLKFK